MESDIPGFYKQGNRYYRLPAVKRFSAAPAVAKTDSSAPRRKVKPKRQRELPSTASLLASRRSTTLSTLPSLSHNLRLAHYAGVRYDELILPECLVMGDTISAVCIDGTDPALLRIGTTGGAFAHGKREAVAPSWMQDWENASSWRLDWQFSSPISCLRSYRSRFLATAFGPPASAMFATSESSASLASVILNPRQTSIWSCALAADFLALGCDDAILLSHDPTSRKMRTLQTGSAVLALDAHESTLIYGLRSGLISLEDLRGQSAASTRFQLDSPVTHLHSSVSSFDLVTAAFGGQLAVYDTRFARRPRLRLRGHVNTCSTQLGMTIAGDVLLAAGDDTQIRAWSILTGEAVRPLVPSEDETTERQLLGRIFDEPVRSMAYAPRHGKRSGTLFVATGGGLECYAVP